MEGPLSQLAARVAASLAVGLLVGLERGWRDRDLPDGGRVAGLRTFALIGLLGGLVSLWNESPLPAAIGLAAVAMLFGFSYRRASQAAGTLSITTAVAALVTFALGVLAAQGQAVVAIGCAVIVALLLDLKQPLHAGLRLIEPEELKAVLQLGLLSAVILPLLPDHGYGPYGALNPFNMWLAVVLIAALSIAGHVAVRWKGAHTGLLWAGLLGSLASSTAATLTLARAVRANPGWAVPAAAGVVAGCGVMFVRMAIVVGFLQPMLAWPLSAILVMLGLACFAIAGIYWRSQSRSAGAKLQTEPPVFDVGSALAFGLLLGAVSLLARAAHELLGPAGLSAVAFVSGLADVDAIVISAAQMFGQGQGSAAAVALAVLLAGAGSLVMKGAMAAVVGGRRLGVRVAGAYAFVGALGALAALAALR